MCFVALCAADGADATAAGSGDEEDETEEAPAAATAAASTALTRKRQASKDIVSARKQAAAAAVVPCVRPGGALTCCLCDCNVSCPQCGSTSGSNLHALVCFRCAAFLQFW
jgi:hypothetical protein